MIDSAHDKNLKPIPPKTSGAHESLSKDAYFFHKKGDTLFVSSRFEEAKNAYQNSLEAYQKEGDLLGAGLTLTRLGKVLEILGEYGEARQVYKESLRTFQGSSDLQGIARSKAHLGNVCW